MFPSQSDNYNGFNAPQHNQPQNTQLYQQQVLQQQQNFQPSINMTLPSMASFDPAVIAYQNRPERFPQNDGLLGPKIQLQNVAFTITEDQLRSAGNPAFLRLELENRRLETVIQLQSELLLSREKEAKPGRATFNKDDYCNVSFWSKPRSSMLKKAMVINVTDQDSASNSPSSSPPPTGRKKKGKNQPPPSHLEKEDSTVISKAEYKELLRDLKGFWHDNIDREDPPENFSGLGASMQDKYRDFLETRHWYLALCDNHWKVDGLWMTHYHSWKKNHCANPARKQNTRKRQTHSDDPDSEELSRANKRYRTPEKVSNLILSHLFLALRSSPLGLFITFALFAQSANLNVNSLHDCGTEMDSVANVPPREVSRRFHRFRSAVMQGFQITANKHAQHPPVRFRSIPSIPFQQVIHFVQARVIPRDSIIAIDMAALEDEVSRAETSSVDDNSNAEIVKRKQKNPVVFTILKTLRERVESLPDAIPLGIATGLLQRYSVEPSTLTDGMPNDDPEMLWDPEAGGWDSEFNNLLPHTISMIHPLVLRGEYGLIGLVCTMEHLVQDLGLDEFLLDGKVNCLLQAIDEVCNLLGTRVDNLTTIASGAEPSSCETAGFVELVDTRTIKAPGKRVRGSWKIPDDISPKWAAAIDWKAEHPTGTLKEFNTVWLKTISKDPIKLKARTTYQERASAKRLETKGRK
ncbi:hypothetical protein E1B28_005610 [Marasmius oreades]|uniref:Uncharacterized protein n=1 Tax=Marasmius oreades TaxID=181124 RepID=A0A9P7S3I2_9AGAR|nr:uncharacterized protein E1B28_005610 [Marasmius oreades]KAG7094796.1 hypothetical protein E1B28_005610 [Marasmius oreades]